ncbi:MAG: crossover junction endodeoxyribonuclease RuvC [Ignavibacteriaceae bacterium]|nr:crossover junction endodeoxyribonuclease RuvC [Ignavibacteriaceae bacterium]
MIILGIDPGSVRTGYGIISAEKGKLKLLDTGAITFQSGIPMSERLHAIYTGLQKKMNEYHPDELAIETAFFGKNVQSALKLGYARGVAIVAAVNKGLAVYEYSPREVKKSVTGNGAAAKEQVAFMVRTILNLKNKPLTADAADALGIALCHSFKKTETAGAPKNWGDFIKKNPGRVIL